ncbi:MAG: flagellar basal body-associated FliL family protein [Rhodobacteraceae bacterium]|nr:flagellar basal body-associated FliL family protein [Paracoccaceae bacterium]
MSSETVDIVAPRKKGRILGLLGKLVGSVILLGAGFGGGYVYFANPFSPTQDMLRLIEPEAVAQAEAEAEGRAKVPKETPGETLFQTSYFTFPEPITSNLKESRSFLQVQIGVSTQYDAQVITNVETHKLALQSDMLAVIATFTEEDIAGPNGRARLADALKDAVNMRLERMEGFGGVEDVFFSSFMMQ